MADDPKREREQKPKRQREHHKPVTFAPLPTPHLDEFNLVHELEEYGDDWH